MSRALMMYSTGCAVVGATAGMFVGYICMPIGLLWATCRLVWGW